MKGLGDDYPGYSTSCVSVCNPSGWAYGSGGSVNPFPPGSMATPSTEQLQNAAYANSPYIKTGVSPCPAKMPGAPPGYGLTSAELAQMATLFGYNVDGTPVTSAQAFPDLQVPFNGTCPSLPTTGVSQPTNLPTTGGVLLPGQTLPPGWSVTGQTQTTAGTTPGSTTTGGTTPSGGTTTTDTGLSSLLTGNTPLIIGGVLIAAFFLMGRK